MKLFFTLLIMVSLLMSCEDKIKAPAQKKTEHQIISHDFIFQLQKVKADELKNLGVKFIITDIDEARFTPQQIDEIKSRDKKLISYLSIGEAETYRDYWQKSWKKTPPSFLEKENPEWKGNYKVKYWNKWWQSIIFDKLNTIIDDGFDGVYLDIVDAYSYFEAQGNKDAKKQMIDFVKQISKKAKLKNPNFMIIPQNAGELVLEKEYLNSIDGIGKESSWYILDKKASAEHLKWSLKYLDIAKAAGKTIFVIDYPSSIDKQCDFLQQAQSRGYLAFFSTRALDRILPVKCN